jgi:galactose mutarotase-like enzyme
MPDGAAFALAGGGRRIEVTFLEGCPYAQLFAPPERDYACVEPMTPPTTALVSGDGLRFAEPGRSFRAAFRIAVAHRRS